MDEKLREKIKQWIIKANNDLINADATQIHQVVMNLCTNAYHAMKEKGGDLTLFINNITVSDTLPKGKSIPPVNYIQLHVRDTGIGISKDAINRIFDPYFTTKAKGEGTGLGLSVSNTIITNHKGLIDVVSTPGKGSEFSIKIPVLETANISEKMENEIRPEGNGRKICIVDDEPALLNILSQYLSRVGFITETFNNSLDAETYLELNYRDIDLILTDYNMPGMMGLDLVKQLHEKLDKTPPIIMITGFSEKLNIDNFSEYGLAGLLWKPVNRQQLYKGIIDVLGQ